MTWEPLWTLFEREGIDVATMQPAKPDAPKAIQAPAGEALKIGMSAKTYLQLRQVNAVLNATQPWQRGRSRQHHKR